MAIKIKSISEYLEVLSDILEPEKKYGFRGQYQEYNGYAPNLFRAKKHLKNEYYEKNVLDKLKSFDPQEYPNDYLITAIEAQHGGLETRLLDISYNAMLALHFAITPHYLLPEESADDKNGEVFIFEIDKLVQPTDTDLIKYYENIISGKCKSNSSRDLEHLFIDNFNKNNRIRAQQGAFIMFSGNDYRELPAHMVRRIVVDGNKKKNIRSELKLLFGIDNGYVYPELQNQVQKICKEDSNFYYNKNIFNNINDKERIHETITSRITQEMKVASKYIRSIGNINNYSIYSFHKLLETPFANTIEKSNLKNIKITNVTKVINDQLIQLEKIQKDRIYDIKILYKDSTNEYKKKANAINRSLKMELSSKELKFNIQTYNIDDVEE